VLAFKPLQNKSLASNQIGYKTSKLADYICSPPEIAFCLPDTPLSFIDIEMALVAFFSTRHRINSRIIGLIGQSKKSKP
jgi:hypothetical protein